MIMSDGTANRQRRINTNDNCNGIPTGISLNASTSTKIADSNANRIFFAVSNPSNKDIWLKLQIATVDNDKKGIFMPANSYWEMPTDNVYIGEISAIANSGTPDIYTTEY